MFRIDFFSDGYLLLTPRFLGSSRIWQTIFLGLILLSVLFVIWRIYRYELKFITRGGAVSLFALRCLIFTTIFVIALFRPIMRYTSTQVIPSRIIVAVDRSDSMSITDPQRNALESLELAKGLKLASDLADDKQLDAWIANLNAGVIPTAESYRKVLERMGNTPRKTLAARVVNPDGIGLLQTLSESHHVDLIGFSQYLSELPHDPDRLRAMFAADGKVLGLAYTDLKLPLKQGVEHRTETNNGLLAVVVISDGQHNWGESPAGLAQQLGSADSKNPVPVYAVVCGARIPPTDLAITSAKATPATVFKHGSTAIEVRLMANNIPPGRIQVTVEYPKSPDLPDRKPIVEFVEHDGVSQPRAITIPVKMDRAATETLTITAEALPHDGSKVEERFKENNSRKVTVNVAPDKAKVLVVDGEARWELHYLQTALLRDATMDTRSVVFDQPRINAVKEEDLAEMKLPDLKLPDVDTMMRNDCIILGDVSPEQLPMEERLRLEKYVADRGGTLVILAGKRSMPMEFLGDGDPMARMLPIHNPRVADRKDGFLLSLTAEGKQTSFLRLEADAGLSEERWAGLPPHFWGIVGRAKEGAVPLAFLPEGRGGIDQERGNALILRQNYGFGRVVYVGLDSTWRWRFKRGDLYHHRFWSQVIRWAASDRALITGNEFVRFGVREPVYRSDQEVEILVRLNEKVKKLGDNPLASARFFRKTADGKEESIVLSKLKPHHYVPGELDGTQANLPPGDYAMELVIPEVEEKLNGPDGKKLRTHFKVLPPDSGELLDLSTNWERMKEIANRSGGEVMSADQAGGIIEKLKSRTATETKQRDKQLWQSWWLLIPLLCLITAEWLIRKLSGLA